MLERLRVRNYALIDDIDISFGTGLNILSGETGAGKSILIDALGLILGEKGDQSAIRTGCLEASVTATITIENHDELIGALEERGIEIDDGSILIRRVIRQGGRGTITVQSEPFSRKELSDLADILFDLHGQHEHQSILRSDVQRTALDAFAGLSQLVQSYAGIYHDHQRSVQSLEDLGKMERDMLREKDMLSFAVQEISSARLSVDEEESLEAEIRILEHAERLFELIHHASETIKGSGGALDLIRRGAQNLVNASEIDASLDPLSQRVESMVYELEDVYEGVRDYRERIDFSPTRLDKAQERLLVIHSLEKKYGASIEEVLAYARSAEERLHQFEDRDEELIRITQQTKALRARMESAAQEISVRRSEAANALSARVEGNLRELGMPGASFKVEVSARNFDPAGSKVHTSTGVDTIEFLVAANAGEPFKPIKTTASGGELSRIMLALKGVLSGEDDVETLIFDEIDAGIGGAVAVSVGDHLQALADSRQVICITHLATIAAKGDHHLTVSKQEIDGRTFTKVEEVQGERRVEELARMLAGDVKNQITLAHARELLSGKV